MGSLYSLIIVFGSLLVLLGLGIPIAYAMTSIGIIGSYVYWGGWAGVEGFFLGTYSHSTIYMLMAAPLFAVMAGILQHSGLAGEMFEAVYRWLGGVRGGLAAGSIFIGALFGAMVGNTSVATVTLGLTARPIMLEKGYDDKLVLGTVMTAGTLGLIIPPSMLMIFYGIVANISIGRLFVSGIIPGILLTVLVACYAIIRGYITPNFAPAISKEERYTWKEKFVSLKGVILPIFVIFLVMGSILFGFATPVESAVIGLWGSIGCAAIKRRLSIKVILDTLILSAKIITAIYLIFIGAPAFANVVAVAGGANVVEVVQTLNVGPLPTLIVMQVIFFIFGMFISPAPILFITLPIMYPIILALGIDPYLYAILFIINMSMAQITPPFGFSFFVTKSIDKNIKIQDLYSAAVPFIALYAIVIVMVAVFPQIALWLPNKLF